LAKLEPPTGVEVDETDAVVLTAGDLRVVVRQNPPRLALLARREYPVANRPTIAPSVSGSACRGSPASAVAGW
jgi:hypothetical protein